MNNGLIKNDDLYWNEEEQRYTSLNEEEIQKVLESTFIAGGSPRKMSLAKRVVDWATKVRVSNLILQGVLSGRIKILAEKGEQLYFQEIGAEDELRSDDRTIE